MKYIKLFEDFKDISKDIVDDICKKYSITNYTINDDGSIDVDGDVYFINSDLYKIPLNFRNISGHFHCNYQLTSLEGAPQSVGGDFVCSHNKLTSLEGAPESVGGDFHCVHNKLTSLEGAPESVGGHFNCSNNQLTSLEGAPLSVGGHFHCVHNKLRSLEGAPESVAGNFVCFKNPVYKVWELFNDYSKMELLNDYDPFREVDGKPAIIIERLNDFLQEIGKDPVEKVDEWINI